MTSVFASNLNSIHYQNEDFFKMSLDIPKRKFFFFSASMMLTINFVKLAYAQAFVEESQPQAAALGYKSDALRVDQSKYAKFSPGQSCSSCALYQGAPGSNGGGCALFAGKQVMANGWCSAYARKAGAFVPPAATKPIDIPQALPTPAQSIEQQKPAVNLPPQQKNSSFPSNQAAKKCARLGLTPGSEDYKLCIGSM